MHAFVKSKNLSKQINDKILYWKQRINRHHGENILRKVKVLKLTPGTRLKRVWKGNTYCVTVLDRGFELNGVIFNSLSAAARHITGTRWNGKAFFGLKKR
ncbi:DUF2924 domain-containing protein [Magnetococcales bacterium HHB-1]